MAARVGALAVGGGADGGEPASAGLGEARGYAARPCRSRLPGYASQMRLPKLRGERIGQATDRFNIRWAVLSAELADLLRDRSAGADVLDADIALRWVARDDARNYVVLGDPAVRLRVRDMT